MCSHETRGDSLKAQGFSLTSSNRRQALKLLASAPDLGPSLSSSDSQPGHVIFATVASDSSEMLETLEGLAGQLRSEDSPCAPVGVIGFTATGEGVGLMSPNPALLPVPMQPVFQTPALVLRAAENDDDIRPIYVIPWIPGIEGSQNPELQAQGLSESTARLLTQAMAIVGSARPPVNLTVSGAELLDRATFGVFQWWQDGDRSRFARKATDVIEQALRTLGATRLSGEALELDLPNDDKRDAVIDRLEHTDPNDPTKNLLDAVTAPPTLFDYLPSITPSESDPDEGDFTPVR